MKKIIMGAVAALFVAGAATTATANDFNDFQSAVTVDVGDLSFEIENHDATGFHSFEFDYTVLGYSLGENVVSELDLGATYFDLGDTLTLDVQYSVTWFASPMTDVYGSLEMNYFADGTTALDGDVLLTPEVGVEFDVANAVSIFGDVEYGFNATDSARDVGGNVEVGVNWDVADNITFTPSVVHYFDLPAGASDNTQARFEIGLKF